MSEQKNLGIWDSFLNATGANPINYWVFGTFVVMVITHYFYGMFIVCVGVFRWPRWLYNYKIPHRVERLDEDTYLKAVEQVIVNQLVIATTCVYISYNVMCKFLTPCPLHELPTMTTFVVHLTLMFLLEEPLFYYAHRLLHHHLIFKHIHKKNHDWNSPIAATTLYCHSLEFILINVGPIVVSVLICRPHVLVLWTFIIITTVYAMNYHTGYYFPLPFGRSTSLFHNVHRASMNCNFGIFGWFDKLHGTYKDSNIVPTRKQIRSRRPRNKIN